MEVKARAYPKINLGLYVGNKRSDGFHELISIFQKVDCFFDEIIIDYNEDSLFSLKVNGLENIENDTISQAVKLFVKKTDICGKFTVTVKKSIPQKSGMGGGSSDAASVLLAINRMFKKVLTFEELLELGMKIGSDVPFFLYETRAAVVTGRGEFVKPIEEREFYISIKDSGNKKLSTADAYRKLDEILGHRELPSEEYLLEQYYADKPAFRNDFELLYPPLEKEFSLTGSGSWCYHLKTLT